ncbi:MAG: family 16 glycoside hydrolase [Planctomycetota bacterium]|jgi:tetratricopeptide (TPR) repeat protein
MKKSLCLWAVFTAMAVVGPYARADRETAKYFTKRGDKSLRAKEWDKAEESYRRALEEDESYLPARFGLAEALIKSGKQPAGVLELRRIIEDSEKTPPEPAWKRLISKTKKRLEELDASGRALQKILDGYVSAMVAVSKKCMKQDPEVAERALRRILKIRPGSTEAAGLLKKMGKSASGDARAIFNGKNLSGWNVGPPDWKVLDGCIIAETPTGGSYNRTELYLKGDFDILAEMKLLKQYPGGPPGFNIVTGIKKDFDWYAVGVFNGRFSWAEQEGGRNIRNVFQAFPTDLPNGLDIEEWNVFELRCRGDEAVVFLNGKELAREPWAEKRREGYIGLWVQNAKVSIRKFQLTQR